MAKYIELIDKGDYIEEVIENWNRRAEPPKE
jgi:hypothetical protein